MRTEVAKIGEFNRQWLLVDAENMVLGRLATQIANVLRGKHRPTYSPNVDTGDFVVVINAEKITLTGNKTADKLYYRHTGFPGGIKSVSAGELLNKKPEELIRKAVKGMLPKNKLARQMIKKLKVYSGSAHPHEAQQPSQLPL